jgi:ABC-type nitrate/sulfonate/bicarbonate transport system ATPase subunit
MSRLWTGILVTHNTLEAALLADRPVPIVRRRRLDDERLFRLQAEVFAAVIPRPRGHTANSG